MADLVQLSEHPVKWPDTRRPASLGVVLLHFPLIFSLLFFIFYFALTPDWMIELITIVAVLCSIYGLFLSTWLVNRSFNFSVVYGSYLTLSHLGMVASDLFISDALERFILKAGLRPYHLEWYYSDHKPFAVALAGLGISAFFLGSGLVGRLMHSKQPRRETEIDWQHRGNQPIFFLGVFLLILCTIYLIGAFLFGLLPLFSTYLNYVSSISVLPSYSLFLVLLSVGLTFVIATGSARQIRRWIIFFIIPAILLVLTGNRGEILYALAASVAIAGIRGYHVSYRTIIVLISIFFVLIPLVRDIRQTEFNRINLNEISINLTDPFVELGFQLRPLMATVGWIESGEEFANGGTYLLPMQRIIGLVVPFVERPAIEGRFDIAGRLPTQGYTVIAEAYFNFAVGGVILVLGGIGLFFSIANRATTSRRIALYGAVAAILINNQRNHFIFVPGQIIIVLLLVVLAHVFSKRDNHNIQIVSQ